MQERPMDYALALWSHVKPESLRSPGGRMSGKCPVSLSNWSADWGKGSLVKYGWVRSALLPNWSWVYFLMLRFRVKDWATKFFRWINIKHVWKYFSRHTTWNTNIRINNKCSSASRCCAWPSLPVLVWKYLQMWANIVQWTIKNGYR